MSHLTYVPQQMLVLEKLLICAIKTKPQRLYCFFSCSSTSWRFPVSGLMKPFKSNILRQQVNVSLCLHKVWFHLIMNRQWHSWMCTNPEKQSTTLWLICLVVNVLCKHRKLEKLKILYWSHKNRNSNSVIKTARLEVCKPIMKALLC